ERPELAIVAPPRPPQHLLQAILGALVEPVALADVVELQDGGGARCGELTGGRRAVDGWRAREHRRSPAWRGGRKRAPPWRPPPPPPSRGRGPASPGAAPAPARGVPLRSSR